MFEEAGFAAVTADWPDDPPTVAEANAHPEVMAGKTVGEIADHVAELIGTLERKPVVIGHSFGGLMAQIIAGRGLSTASPWRSTRPRSAACCRCRSPRCGPAARCSPTPRNRNRAIPLTYDQFRYAFANAVSEEEAKALYEEFAVPAPGAPLFQAAAANLNPWTEVEGRHGQPGARPAADHLGRAGPHDPLGAGERGLQAAEATTRASRRSSRSPAAGTRW